MDYQLPTNKSLTKEDVEVGKLSDNVPSQNAFPSQGNEVGKLTIQQVKPNEKRTMAVIQETESEEECWTPLGKSKVSDDSDGSI